ncbi:TonB-dependent receptor [Granulicella cerasi]|uniref:TonB-dependent receptor n=1 Tax=Granulicella cerasi TaxID=741063 RepID=UPI0021DF68C8|nr:TonB-dependent receptor [Granulicella cerasi]
MSASAQTFRGGINGTVTDPTGAVVPGAVVIATDESTGLVHTMKATGSGDFTFSDLPLDSYTITVTANGFAVQKIQHVQVSQGSIYTAQVKLSLASSGQEISVSANQLALDTTSTTQTTVITGKSVDAMPLNGRDFTQMVAITPGFAGYAIGGGGTGMGALNGTRFDQMNWQIDGVDNNDFYANVPAVNQGGILGIPGVVMPIDAVDQFSVQTQGNAEAGRNPGGVVNLGIKSGGNQFHGTAYYYNRNELYSAPSPFLAAGETKKRNRNYNAGFSFGGPIIKDKLFFFSSLETQTFSIGQNGLATEPSYAYQAQAKALLAKYGVAVNPVGQNILNTFYPAYALGGAAAANNYSSNIPQSGHSWNGVLKLDYAINEKNTLSVRGFGGEGNQTAPNGSELAPYYEVGPIHVWNYAVVLNTMATSKISNQLLLGVNYFNQLFNNADQNFNVAGTGLVTGSQYPSEAPKIRISGFDKAGIIAPSGRNDITGHLNDTVSYTVGSHAFRFGGEFRRGYVNVFNSGNSTGQFNFTGQGSKVSATNPGWSADTTYGSSVNALADLLAGYYSTATIAIGSPQRWVYANAFDFFAQDSWRLGQRLTLNYGIRYDYEGPLYDNDKDLSVFIPGKGVQVLGNGIDSLYPSDKNNFAPRLGFSYQPFGASSTMVIRGGVGMYYDQPIMAAFLNNSTSNSSPLGVQANPDTSFQYYSITATGGPTHALTTGVNPFGGVTRSCSPSTPCGAFSIDQNMRTPYVWNYNLNVEQQLGSKILAQLGYVGNESRKLLGIRDINQAKLQANGSPSTAADQLTQQMSRPYSNLYPNYGNINQVGTFQTGNYNSLQATVKMQAVHGFTAQAAYTWAHAFDEGSVSRSQLPQNSNNIKGEYGNAATDTRHTFVGLVTYTPPTVSGSFERLRNGWQFNSMVNFHTGAPFTVYASADTSGTDEGAQRANLVGNPYSGISRAFDATNKSETWINAAAFADPANGTYGTTARNAFYGPGFGDVDISVYKATKITQGVAVQIRAEMFNVFNRKNFAPPNNTIGDSLGTVSSTIGEYSGAPSIGPGEPFSMQLGAKIIF